MNLRVSAPERLTPCSISLPLSKSVVNRLLMLNPDLPIPAGSCDDLLVMKSAVEKVQKFKGSRVQDSLSPNALSPNRINLQASGTAMRFITALCSVTDGKWLLTGDARQYERPISALVDALRSLGADIEYTEKQGFPPLHIRGKSRLEGGDVTVDARQSSQYVSALMLVADKFKNKLKIYHNADTSLPYIRLTEEIINNPETVPEADWSAASFWYEISLISGIEFQFENLNKYSFQGDREILNIYQRLKENYGETVEMDFADYPDLVLPVVVACCLKGVPFRFTGVRNLRIKESDRLSSLQTELKKLGYELIVKDDEVSYVISHPSSLILSKTPVFDTHNDHRIAMSLAPCALLTGEVIINDAEVVNKSYPDYWKNLEKAGFKIEKI